MNLGVRQLVRLGRRWWWLIALLVLVAGGLGHEIGVRRQPLYAATSTLVVQPVLSTGGLDYSALQGSASLVETYRRLVATWPVLDPVIAQLRLPDSREALKEKTTVSAQPQSQLIEITVSDPDPRRAAQIADGIATRFVAYIGETTTQLSGPTRSVIDEQFTATQEQIDQVSLQISALEISPSANDPTIQTQIASLRTTLTQLRDTYAQLQETKRQLDLAAATAQTQVAVATPATVPAEPYAPRVLLYTLLAAFVGVLVAVAAVALLELRDTAVRLDTDFAALAGAPLLSTIARVRKLKDGPPQLFMRDQPTSPAAEAVRLLRANLAFVATTEEATAFTVSSPGPSEGKSTMVANVGVAMAEAGLRTVVVDANLRRARLHRIFGVPNDRGLTTLLMQPDLAWSTVAVQVRSPNLTLIPSGPLPLNPAALLNLERLRRLLDELRGVADVILLDSPPLLAVSDSLTIATTTDGVLLVCRSGQTSREALRRAALTLEGCGARTLGVVLNAQPGRHGQPYGAGPAYDPELGAARGRAATARPAARDGTGGATEVAPSGATTQFADG